MPGGLFGKSTARGGEASASAALDAMTLDPRARVQSAHGGSHGDTTSSGVRRALSVPKEFPGLLELDAASLAELLLDKETFARFLHGTEGASEARAFTRDLRLEIESMARANIALFEEASDLRSQIHVIRAVDMKPVAEAYAAAKKKTDALVDECDLGRALHALQERAASYDAASEEVSEKWFKREIEDVDAFVSQFRELREKHHEDAVKASVVAPGVIRAEGSSGGGNCGGQPPPPPTRGYPGRPRYGHGGYRGDRVDSDVERLSLVDVFLSNDSQSDSLTV